jgi:hypothetical protein
VTVPIAVDDATEAQVSPTSLVIGPGAVEWSVPRTVTVTGLRDQLADGDIPYSVIAGPAVSADPLYAAPTATARSVLAAVNTDVTWPEITAVVPQVIATGLNASARLVLYGSGFRSGIAVELAGELLGADPGGGAPSSVPTTNTNTNTSSSSVSPEDAIVVIGDGLLIVPRPARASTVANKTGPITVRVINPDDGFATAELYGSRFVCPGGSGGSAGGGFVVASEDGVCVPCPRGGVCPGGPVIDPAPGYWNGDRVTTPVACDPAERCLGGIGAPCAEGNMGRACAQCAPGYFEAADRCVPCEQSRRGGPVVTVIILCVVLLAMAAVLALSEKRQLHVIVWVAVACTFFWAVNLMAPAVGPSFPHELARALSVLTLDYAWLRPGCSLVPNPSASQAMVVTVAAFALLIALVCVIVFLRALLFGHGGGVYTRVLRAAAIMVAVAAITAFRRAIESMHCVTQADGVRVVDAYRWEECLAGSHRFAFALGLLVAVLMLTVPTVLLVWLAVQLWRSDARESDYVNLQVKHSRRYGFLYLPLRMVPARYYAALAYGCQLVVAVAAGALHRHETVMFVVVEHALVVMLVATVLARPFRSRRLTIVSASIYVLAMLVAVCNFASLETGGGAGHSRRALEALYAIAWALFFALLLWCATFPFWEERDDHGDLGNVIPPPAQPVPMAPNIDVPKPAAPDGPMEIRTPLPPIRDPYHARVLASTRRPQHARATTGMPADDGGARNDGFDGDRGVTRVPLSPGPGGDRRPALRHGDLPAGQQRSAPITLRFDDVMRTGPQARQTGSYTVAGPVRTLPAIDRYGAVPMSPLDRTRRDERYAADGANNTNPNPNGGGGILAASYDVM